MELIKTADSKKALLKMTKKEWLAVGQANYWESDEAKEFHREEPEIPGDPAAETTGWCEDCQQPCHGKTVDEGIGAYEFWGSKEVHHDYRVRSNCCEALILNKDPNATEDIE